MQFPAGINTSLAPILLHPLAASGSRTIRLSDEVVSIRFWLVLQPSVDKGSPNLPQHGLGQSVFKSFQNLVWRCTKILGTVEGINPVSEFRPKTLHCIHVFYLLLLYIEWYQIWNCPYWCCDPRWLLMPYGDRMSVEGFSDAKSYAILNRISYGMVWIARSASLRNVPNLTIHRQAW